jgi:membrane protein
LKIKSKVRTFERIATSLWGRGEAWFERVRRERTWFGHMVRAGVRYTEAKGNRLAAALTYRSFLAVFPVLLLAFSILGFVLNGNPHATEKVASYLEENLPTLKVDAIASQRLTAGLIGLFGVLYAGLTWVEEIRAAVRTMWNRDEDPASLLLAKLVDVLVMVVLGVVLVASTAVTFAFNVGASAALGAVGIPSHGVGFNVLRIGVAVVLDVVLVTLLLTFVPRLGMSWRRLWMPALLGGVALEVLKEFAQLFVAYAVTNPAYALVATAVGLLLFFDFFSRILLFCAAITATSTVGRVRDRPVPSLRGFRLLKRSVKAAASKATSK